VTGSGVVVVGAVGAGSGVVVVGGVGAGSGVVVVGAVGVGSGVGVGVGAGVGAGAGAGVVGVGVVGVGVVGVCVGAGAGAFRLTIAYRDKGELKVVFEDFCATASVLAEKSARASMGRLRGMAILLMTPGSESLCGNG
jgi:hypothetical protein